MIKKKAKCKTTTKKAAKKRGSPKSKTGTNPTEVRKRVSKMVESKAVAMTKAVIGETKHVQLATVKYLFEVASIYPPATDGNQATADEDCLAKTLLHRLNLPEEPITHDEDDKPKAETSAAKPAVKPAEDESEKDPGTEQQVGEESEDSVLV
jgi:hypothetical protein